MDCETFDRDVVDLLYEDGDEASREALALHASSCARCGATVATLRLARDQAARLPRAVPPEGLTRKILAAEAVGRKQPPLSRRVARGAAWAGSLAMRPQFAMAALFCLAVGSSLLLLRARSDSVPGPMSIREEGLPSPEPAAPAAAPAPAASSRHASRTEGGSRGDDAKGKATPADAAPPAEAPAATAEASVAPPAAKEAADGAREALAGALEKLRRSGCEAALADLRAVAAGFAGTAEAAEATREADGCTRVAAAPAPTAPRPAAAPGGAAAPDTAAPKAPPPAKAGPSAKPAPSGSSAP
jgi:hypothetical protein